MLITNKTNNIEKKKQKIKQIIKNNIKYEFKK